MLPRQGQGRSRSVSWSWSWSYCCWLLVVCVAECAGQCFQCSAKSLRDANASCDLFVSTDDRFIRDCEPFKGCLTVFNGSRVERSCSEDNTTETCHWANRIRYCYCTEPLCNGGGPPPDDSGGDDDDEGGSGAGGLQGGAVHATPRSRPTPAPAPEAASAASPRRGAAVAVGVGVALLLLRLAPCV